jgi:hypothetical protein
MAISKRNKPKSKSEMDTTISKSEALRLKETLNSGQLIDRETLLKLLHADKPCCGLYNKSCKVSCTATTSQPATLRTQTHSLAKFPNPIPTPPTAHFFSSSSIITPPPHYYYHRANPETLIVYATSSPHLKVTEKQASGPNRQMHSPPWASTPRSSRHPTTTHP